MPVLNWIGKDKVVNHDKELPFRVLKPVKDQSVGEENENLLIQGDNLEALKALMPFYYGKIKCIYIDPPYNTGNEKWIYNDRVNSPQIKSWLNKVVGAEGEDLCRHDKWLCMMYPRLKLLHQLLTEDGVIFISIDENEVHNLRTLMDEIFGERNFVSQLGWQKVYSPKNQSTYFSNDYEFVLCYGKNKDLVTINLLPRTEEMNLRYKNPDNDPRGDWKPGDLVANEERTGGHYVVKSPITGKEFDSPQGKHWSYSKQNMEKFIQDNRIWFGKDGNAFPSIKQFLDEVKQGKKASSLLPYKEYGHTDEAKKELKAIFPELEKIPFETPKPSRLIKNLIRLGSNDKDIVLDSFAGSGTTGQAVLELNKEDGGNRKFILVELEKEIAKNVTAKRLTKVIEGYEGAKFPEGTDQGFQYLDLNGELYDYSGFVNPDAKYEDMAAYIYFTETKNYLDIPSIEKPHIGSLGNTHYFLFFEGKGSNILDEEILKKTDKHKGNKVIYADKCLLDEEDLAKKGIIFKQIPYELKKY